MWTVCVCQLPITVAPRMACKYTVVWLIQPLFKDAQPFAAFAFLQPFSIASGPSDPNVDIYIKA